MKKKLICVFLTVIIIAAVFGGCSTAAEKPSAATTTSQSSTSQTPASQKPAKELNIVYVTPLVANPVWDISMEGFNDAAKKLGFKGQYVGPQQIDIPEMINQIEVAIASKVDGIISMPISPEAMRPTWKKCEAAGIPVVFVGAEDEQSTRLAFNGTDPFNLGVVGGKKLAEKMAGAPIRAIMMHASVDSPFTIEVQKGYEKALKDYPDFKIVTVEANNSDMMVAVQKFEAAFKAYPEANVVIAMSGEAPPAAAKVIKEQKLNNITVIGIDDFAETMDAIKEGTVFGTLIQNWYKLGYDAAKILVDYVKDGKKPAKSYNDTGTLFVDKSNINNYNDILRAEVK